MTKVFSSSAEETIAFGRELASSQTLQGNRVIALWGDCGSGKTQLVKGIVSTLIGQPIDSITSPTFTIMQAYLGSLPIYHFDLYRLRKKEEFFLSGFGDHLEENAICLIEWPDLIADALPITTLHITLSHENEGRSIEIAEAKI